MPFGPYENHADCVAQNKDKGDPDAYCATIERNISEKSEEGFAFDELPAEAKDIWVASFGEALSKNDEEGSRRVAWANVLRRFERSVNGRWTPMKVFDDIEFKSLFKQDRVIYGAASVAIVDSDNEMITEEALKSAFRSYVERGHVLFYHRNIPVGEVIPKYVASDGTNYKSEVRDGKLNIAVRLYKDTQIANDVWDAIEKGELRAFSIGGQVIGDPVRVCVNEDCSKNYDRIDKIDLHEISIVPDPANDASYFNIIKSKVEVKETPEQVKLRKLAALINDEKNQVLNCKNFTEEANRILKEGDNIMPAEVENQLKALQDAVAKLEARIGKEEHPMECPDGHHMVDGKCVPMEEKNKSPEVKDMTEDMKKEPAQPDTKPVETKAETPPAPAPVKTELDAIRAQVGGLAEAFAAVKDATQQIAELRSTLVKAPNPVIRAEPMANVTQTVSFDPDRKPTPYMDWASDSQTNVGSFDERMKRIASEMGGQEKKEDAKPEETKAPESSQAELDSLKESVLGLAKSIKTTMDDIRAIKEKAEVNELRAKIEGLTGTIDEYRKEITGLKETLARGTPTPQPVAVPAPTGPSEKRTIAPPDGHDPLVEIVDWEAGPREGSFEARLRRMQRQWGVTP